VSELASNPPARLGDPCWSADAVGRAISSIARLSPELEPYFISTHAPNEHLGDDKRGGYLDEAELFERLFGNDRTNVFAIVRGDPGTGKSHLIRWLHLKCVLDISHGRMPNVLPVLVQRRTGSLKDALTQIVEQLPTRFHRHLGQIKEAIGNLSEDRARQALAGALQLQLVDSVEVPATLSHLHEACLSPDFRRWLIRPGGVIDRIVRQLTQESDVIDREALPAFTAEELRPPQAFHENNAPSTRGLIEDLDYLPELRDKAADLFNAVRRPAVRAMSGLIGSGLRDVFDAIRRELRSEGKRLALFVEDVSVMASLDDDVLNAVEPNPDPQLAELVAVVGMTNTGFKRLPENLLGRTTDIVAVGTDAASAWLRAPNELARFSARYLNVARLTDIGTKRIAAERLGGSDVTHSACSACRVREACHATFGFVPFDGADVGLFPFTQTALHRLFAGLNEGMPAVRKNPRGLLEHLLTPVLRDDRTALLDLTFPRAKLAVLIDEPAYWSAFVAKYLGGWPPSEQSRLRGFAQGWIQAASGTDAAHLLEPFLVPFGFAPFSAAADQGTQQPVEPSPIVSPIGGIGPESEPDALRTLRNDMSRWADGGPLENDETPRGLLLDFLRNAIPWDDESVPVSVYDKLLKNRSSIRFEGQRSRLRSGQIFAFEVPRGEDARAMVEALGRWKWEGRESWNFPGGQLHRRVAARWLRSNRSRIVGALLPPDPPGSEPAIAHAVRVLSVVAMLRRQGDHPPDRPAIVRELLRPLPNELPPGTDTNDDQAVAQLWAAHASARDFLMGELSAPQGGTRGGVVYIDPRPIVSHANSPHRFPVAPEMDSAYTKGNHFWQAPYLSLSRTNQVADLSTLFDSRRTAFLQMVARRLRPAMLDARLDPDDLEVSVTEYCRQISELLPVQASAFPRSHPELDGLRTAFAAKGKAWAQSIAAVKRAATADGVVGLLTAPVAGASEATNAIATCHQFLQMLEAELRASEQRLVSDGDVDVLLADLRRALRDIAGGELPVEGSRVPQGDA
jgi:hypothetical protein